VSDNKTTSTVDELIEIADEHMNAVLRSMEGETAVVHTDQRSAVRALVAERDALLRRRTRLSDGVPPTSAR
jgi:hypothetical protein